MKEPPVIVPNFYDILETHRYASHYTIEDQFQKLFNNFTRKPHQTSTHQFLQLCQAYHILSDSQKRVLYNKNLDQQKGHSAQLEITDPTLKDHIVEAIEYALDKKNQLNRPNTPTPYQNQKLSIANPLPKLLILVLSFLLAFLLFLLNT